MKIVDIQFVKDKTINFCKKQSLKGGLLKAAEAWEKENYEEIQKIISDAMKAGDSKDTGHNYFSDIEKRLIREVRNPIPILEGLNQKVAGGLAGGELGVILSPTGGGKSMVLVKFGCSALLAGKTVVYYSLELAERVIGNRFDSCLTGVKLGDILQMSTHIKEELKKVKALGGNLVIREFPTGSASVNTIKNHIRILERDRIIPDVIFVDYADIMKPTMNFNEKRFSLTSIYEGLRALSMELNIPIWTASQAGRAAINESKFDLRVISESLGKAQTADVIIGLGRTDEDKQHKTAKFMILKNRNGEDGTDVNLHFDTSNLNIYVQGNDNLTGLENLDGNVVEAQLLKNRQLEVPDYTGDDVYDDTGIADPID